MEQTFVGDETGVQRRFSNNVGQGVPAACVAFGLDLRFADYKASGDRSIGGKVPDVICMTSRGDLRIIGELKTPWVTQHDLLDAYRYGRSRLDRIFGQIARYMHKAQIKYGFISTYDWTIFLRQDQMNGQRPLEYSPLIAHSDRAGEQVGDITVKEVFWFLARISSGRGHVANNNVPIAIGSCNFRY